VVLSYVAAHTLRWCSWAARWGGPLAGETGYSYYFQKP
jgi:hypothetical protein